MLWEGSQTHDYGCVALFLYVSPCVCLSLSVWQAHVLACALSLSLSLFLLSFSASTSFPLCLCISLYSSLPRPLCFSHSVARSPHPAIGTFLSVTLALPLCLPLSCVHLGLCLPVYLHPPASPCRSSVVSVCVFATFCLSIYVSLFLCCVCDGCLTAPTRRWKSLKPP